jgi:L-ascorbate metabolism protein UlaG (beta-lactamase superfamily)
MKQKRIQAAYIDGPTALFEWHGFRLLTDPTFDPPGGKYQNGPMVLEKTIGPALAPEVLGREDTVLLSHDHHLDNLVHSGRTFLAGVPRLITTPDGAERLGGNSVGLAAWQNRHRGRRWTSARITGPPAQHGPAHIQRGR